MEKINPKIFLTATIISLISILPFEIGFYTFTRIAITLCSIAAIMKLHHQENNVWLLFAAIAIFYNPIIPTYLGEKSLWVIVNILTAIAFIWLFIKEERGLAALDRLVAASSLLLTNTSWRDRILIAALTCVLLFSYLFLLLI